AKCAGYDVDTDDLHAALGLSMVAYAVPGDMELANWSMYGRDAFLVDTARAFGMTVRAIHPPEAARGLGGAAEFAQHFDASYRPLIARALEHDQPVLAWRGWPGDHRLAWGLIKEACLQGVGFRGVVLTEAGAPSGAPLETLETPPVQVYVVENAMPVEPPPDALLKLAVGHTRQALCGKLTAPFGVITGIGALRYWSDAIASNRGMGVARPGLDRSHQVLATSTRNANLSAVRFLQRLYDRAPTCDGSPADAPGGLMLAGSRRAPAARAGVSAAEADVPLGKRFSIIRSLAILCNEVAGALGRSTELSNVRTAMATPEGRARLIEDLKLARTSTMDLHAVLEAWVRARE
ncbi:MAG: hypothetical protein IID43_06830, partial [Planctomycetes bacterium]|nr:hypothetical protein [Planctomycetota bacterium]